ncbi:hypothetical protein EBR66_02230 [bacterium]|nr:hypothetical protein [bacterium]
MYHKYNTEALVLGSREYGESDRVFALFTKDFGLVRARAGAVRAESSKMRYALQSGSHITVSLVKGKRGWRAVGAVSLCKSLSPHSVTTFMRTARLVLRLVLGEEQNQYLFDTLLSERQVLVTATKEECSVIELLSVARVLYSLGYLSPGALNTALFANTSFAEDDMESARVQRELFLSHINTALSESHL